MRWQDGTLEEATLRATTDGPCRLRADRAVTVRTSEDYPVDVRHPEPGVTAFDTAAGSTYVITPRDRLP